jgi:aminopeptidase N
MFRVDAALTALLLSLAFFLSPCGALAQNRFSLETTPGQLPKDVIPLHYRIRIDPDLDQLSVRGAEEVDIRVRKPTRKIVLNVLDLEITEARLVDKHRERLAIRADAERQTATLEVPTPLAPGTYRLALQFKARINDSPQGLFRVKYRAPSGGGHVMLATQMEPTDARRLFPCWDEPVFRATYELTFVAPEGATAMSNMPVANELTLPDGRREFRFLPTPPMASYLVAVTAGEFETAQARVDGTEIRVIVTEGRRASAAFALEAAQRLVHYYNGYFGVRYALPKLDLLAVPSGGFPEAMENWGLIVYDEKLLLFDPEASSAQTREDVVAILAHEIAHQWFGNLVTMAWWDDLWLSEGFATWMEVKATDALEPSWGYGLKHVGAIQRAMQLDARRASHPIHQQVESDEDAANAFDPIIYAKAAAVLRMFETNFGEAVFRRGVQRYIAAHRYGSATTADFWDALAQASGKPVGRVAAGWTEQPGYPLLEVASACRDDKRTLNISQWRFVLDDPEVVPVVWTVPVTVGAVGSGAAPSRFLLDREANIALPGCAVAKVNLGGIGYFRVAYDDATFASLVQQMSKLPAADRLNLLDDSWALVSAGRLSAANYLDLIEGIADDDILPVWLQVLDAFATIEELELDTPGRDGFHAYAVQRLRGPLRRIGWSPQPGEAQTTALLRARLIEALGTYGDREVIGEARARFDAFLKDAASLPAPLRDPVVYVTGRHADATTYERLHSLALAAPTAEEKSRYYRAMTAAADPDLARRSLALALSDERPPADAVEMVVEVSRTGLNAGMAWEFAQQNSAALIDKLAAMGKNSFMGRVAETFSDNEHADQLEAFARRQGDQAMVTESSQFGGAMRIKATMKSRDLPVIDDWIRRRAGG